MPDKDALYDALFQKYCISMKNYCVSRGVAGADAEDIVSEAFARALEHAELFSGLEPPKQRAWLYSAVTRILKEEKARKQPVPFSEIEGIENLLKADDEITGDEPEEKYRQYVRQVYEELSEEKDRELFRLIFERKIDYAALSTNYGITSGSVRSMVSRFRKRMRKIVNKVLNS